MVGIFLNQLNNKILVKGKLSRYRDFIYIDDVISIIIKCIIQNKKYNLLNVCGKKTTVEISLKNLKVWNVNKSILVKGNTPGDQFGIYGSNHKIKKT